MDDARDERRSKNVPPQPERAPGTRAARPRDAATLIIYREHRGTIEVLMGERHHKHKFLPQRYVFPGGRVDPEDSRVRAARPIAPACGPAPRADRAGRGGASRW